jgi:hypothetical protein
VRSWLARSRRDRRPSLARSRLHRDRRPDEGREWLGFLWEICDSGEKEKAATRGERDSV